MTCGQTVQSNSQLGMQTIGNKEMALIWMRSVSPSGSRDFSSDLF